MSRNYWQSDEFRRYDQQFVERMDRRNAGKPHACARCGEPNPDRLDRDGCRDPNCPEQGR